MQRSVIVFMGLFSILTLASCSGENTIPYTPDTMNEPNHVESPAHTSTPFQTLSPQPSLPPSTQTPTQSPISVWLSPGLPAQLVSSIQLPLGWVHTPDKNTASYVLDFNTTNQVGEWIYVLAAPFPTITDSITMEELTAIWTFGIGQPEEMAKLFVDENTYSILKDMWGVPSPDLVQVSSSLNLADPDQFTLGDWAIIEFQDLNPRWKVIEIDGESPIRKDFISSQYPLTIPISLTGKSQFANIESPEDIGFSFSTTNRDPDKLTTVILTGVTALVRATAATMEQQGNTHPGIDIRDWLIEADFTHINNEVPFAEDCPAPQFQKNELVFCSRTKYIELLEDIGTDIVELSGDHFADWGTEAMYYTLDLYQAEGWLFYGGGHNYDEGKQALLVEHNGNKLAFIGCNGKQLGYAQASPSNPGAVHCDYDWLYQEIKRLSESGYLPIVTFQHEEVYTYGIPPIMQEDFRGAAEAGAVIVSGSQAHQPHAVEFIGTHFIHYGLGNLFFDQIYLGLPTRQAFIDRHVFYDGRYISTELLTIMFIDYARPRPMDEEERIELLNTIFEQSIW